MAYELPLPVHPQRSCGQYVEMGAVAYPCYLVDGHDGPCAAQEKAQSITNHMQWAAGQGVATGQPMQIDPIHLQLPQPEVTSVQLPDLGARLLNPLTPTRTRPGDQVLPTITNSPYVADLAMSWLGRNTDHPKGALATIIHELEARKQVGIERYGTPLQAFNGRDVRQDVREEAIDLFTYLYQAQLEGLTEYGPVLIRALGILVDIVSFDA